MRWALLSISTYESPTVWFKMDPNTDYLFIMVKMSVEVATLFG